MISERDPSSVGYADTFSRKGEGTTRPGFGDV
jgi:hypothetical protein